MMLSPGGRQSGCLGSWAEPWCCNLEPALSEKQIHSWWWTKRVFSPYSYSLYSLYCGIVIRRNGTFDLLNDTLAISVFFQKEQMKWMWPQLLCVWGWVWCGQESLAPMQGKKQNLTKHFMILVKICSYSAAFLKSARHILILFFFLFHREGCNFLIDTVLKSWLYAVIYMLAWVMNLKGSLPRWLIFSALL